MSFMFKPYRFTDPEAINTPVIPQSISGQALFGNEAVAQKLVQAVPANKALFLDGYVGAFFSTLCDRIGDEVADCVFLDLRDAWKSSAEMEEMLAESLPEDKVIDPISLFGKSIFRTIESLFDAEKAAALRKRIDEESGRHRLVVVYGCGATLFKRPGDLAAFLDVTPLETVLRIREHRIRNLGDAAKRPLPAIFRRMYYYDYEVCMHHRQEVIDHNQVEFYLDATMDDRLKMIPLDAFKQCMKIQLQSPFRATPVYLEGVWGGTFVKNLRRLPADMKNCAWVFDMIPNEVSLQIRIGQITFNIPFSTFFKANSVDLMGKESVERFQRVFPIRFNYDDTYGGSGNMSIQVHPPRAYNNEHFGEPFQQDESYYCVKTAGSKTYLGLQDDCDVEEFYRCIDKAEKEHVPFDHDKYVNSFPSTEGDQFLLPGGTIHASGRNQVVLEIGSYTIGSYTFKLYDYLRKDLDGNPRPIHSVHGKNVLVTERRRSKIDGVLRPAPKVVREGEGWKEEIVGEHDLIYFSLRRFSFDHEISDSTEGRKFHVLVLVKGDEILVYSKKNPSCCYHARYMDMVVVPASLGEYGIINLGKTPVQVTKTLLK